ncbi:MAG TPA: AAA family ATPase, partial [Pseudomonas sp.]|nr:AAA family ATPase [Pseudomonas sp.]
TTWNSRLARADMLIWVDRSAPLRFWRVLLRTLLNRGRPRPDLPDNCPELLANLPAFLRFMWQTRTSSREAMRRLVATAPSGCRVVCLRTNRDTDVFLATLGTQPDQVKQAH